MLSTCTCFAARFFDGMGDGGNSIDEPRVVSAGVFGLL